MGFLLFGDRICTVFTVSDQEPAFNNTSNPYWSELLPGPWVWALVESYQLCTKNTGMYHTDLIQGFSVHMDSGQSTSQSFHSEILKRDVWFSPEGNKEGFFGFLHADGSSASQSIFNWRAKGDDRRLLELVGKRTTHTS